MKLSCPVMDTVPLRLSVAAITCSYHERAIHQGGLCAHGPQIADFQVFLRSLEVSPCCLVYLTISLLFFFPYSKYLSKHCRHFRLLKASGPSNISRHSAVEHLHALMTAIICWTPRESEGPSVCFVSVPFRCRTTLATSSRAAGPVCLPNCYPYSAQWGGGFDGIWHFPLLRESWNLEMVKKKSHSYTSTG